MKKNFIWYALAAYGIWYLLKKKKVAGIGQDTPAAADAREMVADIVDNTEFEYDNTTFADLYAKDKSSCL